MRRPVSAAALAALVLCAPVADAQTPPPSAVPPSPPPPAPGVPAGMQVQPFGAPPPGSAAPPPPGGAPTAPPPGALAAGAMPSPQQGPQGSTQQGSTPQGSTQQGSTPQGSTPQGSTPQGWAPQGWGPQGWGPPPQGPQGWGTQAPPAADPRLPPGAPDLSGRFPDFPPGYAPRTIPFDGGAPPPGYHVGREPRPALWVTGLSLFSAAYVPSLLVAGTALSEEEEEYAPLLVPIVGPWITVRTTDAEEVGRAYLVLDGIAQAAGAGLFIAGMAAQREVFVRNDRGRGAAATSVAIGPGSLSVRGGF